MANALHARWSLILAGTLASGLAPAEPRFVEVEEAPRSLSAPADRGAALQLTLPRFSREYRAESATESSRSKPFAGIGLSVVELPSDSLPGTRSRPHHALSIASEAPRNMLRSIGIDATECATRFRLPTKVQRDAFGGSRVEVRAQLGLACGF